MFVPELWRYPVKSLAGERLDRVQVGDVGFAGDRMVLVRRAEGGVVTSRTHHQLLGLQGSLGADGVPRVSGHSWASAEALALVQKAAGPGAGRLDHSGPERFDVLPLLVATDGAIAAFGHDSRRLRPNLIIGGVEGLAERSWPGKQLRIGSVVIGVRDLRGRCVMTTFDPYTLEQNPRVLGEIVQKFQGKLGLNCYVVRGGEIRAGDAVQLVDNVGPLVRSRGPQEASRNSVT